MTVVNGLISLNSFTGINTYVNPLLQEDGFLVHCQNAETYPYGGLRRRGGYGTFLGTPDNAQVNSLFDWHRNNGTQFWLYRASGSSLYYSQQGTGAWTICGNGTIANGSIVGHSVLEDTLIVGDGFGSTRHSTDGTSFTNTTGAPISNTFEEFQGRIYAGGTSSNLFWSTTGTASDWTTDSSSILIPGAGMNLSLFKSNNQLYTNKNSGLMFYWDGFRLVDLATTNGPSSIACIGNFEDIRLFLNRKGIFAFSGGKPTVISSPVQRKFYNKDSSGITSSSFDNANGVVHYNDYLVTAGTVTDDFTGRAISNNVLKYDLLKASFVDYQLNNYPTALHSFLDNTRVPQIIFGDANGQCYIFDGTRSDNGTSISLNVIFGIHGNTLLDKEWKRLRLLFNPRSTARVSVAAENHLEMRRFKWKPISSDTDGGVVEYDFLNGERSKFLFIDIADSSTQSLFEFYGAEIELNAIKH